MFTPTVIGLFHDFYEIYNFKKNIYVYTCIFWWEIYFGGKY